VAAKITGVEPASRSLGARLPRSSGEAAPSAADASVNSGGVSITSAAAQLAGLEQALKALPVIDAPRVSALHSAVASGRYVMEPQSIASGLISTERALNELGVGGG
jgi:flagellar biosynthesis anti-sigma factor FlgM